MRKKTVLIGLDGATFAALDPLMDAGVMPFLKGFMASGARAPLHTVIPALTPPAWTSLMTGRSPGQHGVFDFFRKVAPGSQHVRFNTSHDVAVETIWSMANRYGKQVIVLNFPLMFPAPPLDGYIVPGWMPWRQLRHGCHPSGLFDRLKALPGFDARELAMDMTLEEKALEGCDAGEYEDWIQLHIRREQQWLQILRMLMREELWDLTAVLFDGVDKLQHLFWRFLDPKLVPAALPADEERVRQSLLGYFRQLDRILAEIIELAGEGATVVLASDHGFGAQTGTFFVNTWLEQNGFLAWADGKVVTPEPDKLGISQLARHVYQLDWSRTMAYASTPSSNGIHIVQDDGSGIGVPPTHYQDFRTQLMTELLSFRDSATGRPVVSRIWTREEAFSGPFMNLAPDLTLLLSDGGLLSILASDAPYKTRPQPSGTHGLEGVFVAAGPGIRKGVVLPQLRILDVAPVVLHSLGLPVPVELEGRVPAQAYENNIGVDYARLSLPSVQQPSSAESAKNGGAELTEEDERELLRRMRALGYIS